jgi:hypothetical protein
MNMKTFWNVIAMLAISASAASQTHSVAMQPDWKGMSDWKLYQENKFNVVFRIPADSLGSLTSGRLSSDSMKIFLTGAEKIEGVNPQWMGCYLATCKDSQGHIYKVVISHYGGFFYEPSQKMYYQVPAAVSRDWLTFFSNSYIRLFVNINKPS